MMQRLGYIFLLASATLMTVFFMECAKVIGPFWICPRCGAQVPDNRKSCKCGHILKETDDSSSLDKAQAVLSESGFNPDLYRVHPTGKPGEFVANGIVGVKNGRAFMRY